MCHLSWLLYTGCSFSEKLTGNLHKSFHIHTMSMSSELAAAIEDEDLHINVRDLAPKGRTGDISTFQRMISACLGSFITSLVVTPFDVVRIRIQQQEVMPKGYSCCEPTPQAAQMIKSAAGTMESPAPGVFWINQHYCSSAEQCPRITSTFQGMMSISRNEGLGTLWRGLGLTLFMGIPANIIYFTGYEYVRDHSPILNHPLNPLFCGLFARTVAATVVSPVELLKTRLQSIPSETRGVQQNKILSTLLRDSLEAIRANGLGSMFTGLKITLWRDVPFLGIYWLCYELFKDRIGRTIGVDFDATAQKQEDWKVFTTSFLSGSGAGIIAAFFTNPFDVGKTRLQIATDKKPHTKHSMFRFLYSIYSKEGVGALYSGFGPRVMKIAPSCAIMISSYEIGKKIFKDNL